MFNMADVKLNRQYKNFHQLSQFKLAADDTYDARCAEIYITLNRVLVFHCSLCDNKYGSFDFFLEHLSAMHYKNIHEEVNDIEGSKIETKAVFVDYSYEKMGQEQDERSKDGVKAIIEEIEEEYLEEIEGLEMVLDSRDAEHFEEGFEEFNVKNIKKEEIEIEEHTCSSNSTKYEIEFRRGSDVYKCDNCDKRFDSRPKLKKHSITHSTERKHKCKVCGFAFKERSNLNAHVRRHSGQKKICCEMCPKKFFTHSEAAAHRRTHTGERPYICTYCGAAFGTSGALNEHVKRHNNIRPHKCLHCDKRFYDSCQLRDHMAVHTNERPFVCTICSASFARRKSLRVHTKLHINAKEYKCSLCDKSFNQKPALLAHVKIHHKVVDPN